MQAPEIDRLIRSRRRTVGLSITPEGALVVRAPLRMPEVSIRAVVAEKADWILRKQALARRRGAPPVHAYREGELFLYLGEPYAFHFDAGSPGVRLTSSIGPSGTAGTLTLPPCPPEEAKKRLAAWYQKEARQVFLARVAAYGPKLGVAPAAVRLSSAKGRWGSCSRTGVNLVWRLVMAPPAVIDYVVAHELAHMLHPDHSAAFWKEVERVFPGWKAQRKWLRDNGAQLIL